MNCTRIVLSGVALVCMFTSPCFSQPPAKASDLPGFAVVELFTSEGCSSCPAAEAALAQVHDEYKQGVYVLEFHVDYWDYIGWKDVFSSKDYTNRQQQYASVFHLSSTYTPQAIVNGKNELVGSDKAKLHLLINKNLAAAPQASIQLAATASNGHVSVSYKTMNAAHQLLNIALVQQKAETNVKRGENSGRKLPHMNVVRTLKTIDVASNEGIVNIPLPAGLLPGECTIIAYTQDADKWEITAGAQAGIKKDL